MRQHISVAQLAGFFLANLCGMVIVLLGIQFYKDVLPVFTQGDSFMKKDYVIVSKQVSTLGSLVGKGGTFSRADIADMESQPFAKRTERSLRHSFRCRPAWAWRACSSLRRCSSSRCPTSL